MQDKKLYDAEYRFMDIIWELEPVNSTKLARACEARLGWKKPTAYNMLRKLAEKGLVQNESAMVTALVKREEVRRAESRSWSGPSGAACPCSWPRCWGGAS